MNLRSALPLVSLTGLKLTASQTETLFQKYSSFVSNPSPKPSSDELATESQLSDLLQRVSPTFFSPPPAL